MVGYCRKSAAKIVGEMSGAEIEQFERRHRRGGIRETGVRGHAVKFLFSEITELPGAGKESDDLWNRYCRGDDPCGTNREKPGYG